MIINYEYKNIEIINISRFFYRLSEKKKIIFINFEDTARNYLKETVFTTNNLMNKEKYIAPFK